MIRILCQSEGYFFVSYNSVHDEIIEIHYPAGVTVVHLGDVSIGSRGDCNVLLIYGQIVVAAVCHDIGICDLELAVIHDADIFKTRTGVCTRIRSSSGHSQSEDVAADSSHIIAGKDVFELGAIIFLHDGIILRYIDGYVDGDLSLSDGSLEYNVVP